MISFLHNLIKLIKLLVKSFRKKYRNNIIFNRLKIQKFQLSVLIKLIIVKFIEI